MYYFGKESTENLLTCHPDIQIVCNEVIKTVDIKITCGYRGREAQEAAFKAGKSTKHYPESLHNRLPSLAFDFVPCPVDYRDVNRFVFVAGYIVAISRRMKAEKFVTRALVSGGDWDNDLNFREHSFLDWPHLQLEG